MTDLATERQESAARRHLRDRERLARKALNALGWTTSLAEVLDYAIDQWDVDNEEGEAIGLVAIRLKSEGRAEARHIPVDALKEEGLVQNHAEKVREATRAVLKANPEIKRQEAYELVLGRIKTKLTQPNFEVTYFYPIRKALRGDGKGPKNKRPRKENPALRSSKELREEKAVQEADDPNPPAAEVMSVKYTPDDGSASPTHVPSDADVVPAERHPFEVLVSRRLSEAEEEVEELRVALKVIRQFQEVEG